MSKLQKGISLIALIITIAVLLIIAGAVIQKGMSRTDNAKIAEHNHSLSVTQEEVESYYFYKGAELPVVNLTPYPIPVGSSLEKEIINNGEQNDNFYVVDFSKLGKIAGKDGTTGGNDLYIVSSVRHTVYYAKGDTIKGITYHGIITKNDVKLAQIIGATSAPTNSPTPSMTNTPAPSPTNTPTPTPSYTYNNPKIPNGFTQIGTETWDTGFTIQDSNGNQFVWVPVLAPAVQANGTLDNTTFNSKFGRRNFRSANGDIFNSSNFYETNDTALQNMISAVNTYGGFYIGKYEVSNNGSSKVQIKADKAPWVNIDWNNSKAKAESMDTDWGWDASAVESYLCYGAHWDTALQWIIDSTDKTLAQVKSDSSTWGNYWNTTFTYGTGSTTRPANSNTLVNTGVSTTPANRHMSKGIYDLAGNVNEWTMENWGGTMRSYRGGAYTNASNGAPAAYRNGGNLSSPDPIITFRIVLYVK